MNHLITYKIFESYNNFSKDEIDDILLPLKDKGFEVIQKNIYFFTFGIKKSDNTSFLILEIIDDIKHFIFYMNEIGFKLKFIDPEFICDPPLSKISDNIDDVPDSYLTSIQLKFR